QHHGDNALALARAFGNDDLSTLKRESSYDATYFPVLGYLLRYPGYLVWPLAALAVIAVLGLVVVARRRELVTWPRFAGGFGLAPIPLLAAPVMAQVLWLVLVAIRPGYSEMIDPWRPGWYRAGVVALVLAVLLGWYGLLRRRFGACTLALGGLGWLALLGVVLAAFTPGGSYLAALPALFMAVAAIVGLVWFNDWERLVVLLLGAAVAVVVLAPTVYIFFPAL